MNYHCEARHPIYFSICRKAKGHIGPHEDYPEVLTWDDEEDEETGEEPPE